MNERPLSFDLAGIGTFTHYPSMWDGYYLGPELPSDFLGGTIEFAIGNGPLEGCAANLAA